MIYKNHSNTCPPIGKIFFFLIIVSLSQLSFGIEALHLLGSVPGSKYGYVEYLPDGYSETNHWPLIIFLHGIGEQKAPLTRIGDFGPNKQAREGKNMPMVILSPQSSDWWDAEKVDSFLRFALSKYQVDPKRIYLTGLSMGGGGASDYINLYGQKLAAAVVICPAGVISANGAFKLISNKVPTWIAHAADDKTVNIGKNSDVSFSNIIRTLGGPTKTTRPEMKGNESYTAHWDPQEKKVVWEKGQKAVEGVPAFFYTVYHKGGHSIWNRMYQDPNLYEWLLSQHKS